ncbi:MAG: hypothetical protein JNK82_22740 [Myxococcaceae bacterium]|nr:hypothetical protein [Myxococcaceae bacterium]
MPHVIEESKSGRATCRTCRQKIEKGALRFGEETPNPFDAGQTSHLWHHLLCAAQKRGGILKPVLDVYTGEVPNRAELEAAIANPPASKSGGGPKAAFPYAERAATGRSRCIHCDEAIEKGALRVAVEREVDTGSFTRSGAGYLHPKCAVENTGDAELLVKVKLNSVGLSEADVAELTAALAQ